MLDRLSNETVPSCRVSCHLVTQNFICLCLEAAAEPGWCLGLQRSPCFCSLRRCQRKGAFKSDTWGISLLGHATYVSSLSLGSSSIKREILMLSMFSSCYEDSKNWLVYRVILCSVYASCPCITVIYCTTLRVLESISTQSGLQLIFSICNLFIMNIYPHGTIWKKCFTSCRAVTFKAGTAFFQEGECVRANVLAPAHYSCSPCPFLCVCVCLSVCAHSVVPDSLRPHGL